MWPMRERHWGCCHDTTAAKCCLKGVSAAFQCHAGPPCGMASVILTPSELSHHLVTAAHQGHPGTGGQWLAVRTDPLPSMARPKGIHGANVLEGLARALPTRPPLGHPTTCPGTWGCPLLPLLAVSIWSCISPQLYGASRFVSSSGGKWEMEAGHGAPGVPARLHSQGTERHTKGSRDAGAV